MRFLEDLTLGVMVLIELVVKLAISAVLYDAVILIEDLAEAHWESFIVDE